MVELFWERYDQEQFDIHFTLDELRARGVVPVDADPYIIEKLIEAFGLGRGERAPKVGTSPSMS